MFNSKERVRELEHRLVNAESEIRTLRIEWQETYDKIHRLYHRLNQRDRYQDRKQAAVEEANGGGSQGPVNAIDVVSQRILARRRGRNAVPHGGGQPPSV